MILSRNEKGFTLVELLVTMAIIAIIAAILIPNTIGFLKNAKISTANANAKIIYSSAIAYLCENYANDTPVTAGLLAANGVDNGAPLTGYLDANFTGTWNFKVSADQTTIDYAVWADTGVTLTTDQLTSDEQKDLDINSIVGCYPLA